MQVRTALRATLPPPKEPSSDPPGPVRHLSLVETTTFHDFGNPTTIRQTVPPAQFTAYQGNPPSTPSPNCHG
ncbi:MAG: hypothetical protein ACRDY3_08890 [Acidimicrobiales bacterium]